MKETAAMARNWRKQPADPDRSLETSGRSDASLDRLYRLLADGERRALLAFLLERDEPVPLSELRAHVADDGDERRAGIRLVHSHLPKLAEADLVEYDRESGRAAATAVAAELAASLSP